MSLQLIDQIKVSSGAVWKALELWNEAGNDILLRDKALLSISAMLSKCPSVFMREELCKQLAKMLGVSRKELQNRVNVQAEVKEAGGEEQVFALPAGVDADFVAQHGFYSLDEGPRQTGYWFDMGRNARFLQVSNFVVRPLFHLYSPFKEMNKRMMEINNGYVSRTIEMQSRSIVSPESFTGSMAEEGNFLWYGNKTQLMRLNEYWGDKFPTAYELTNLGWQHEGFFAYSDMIYNGDLLPYNEHGIVLHGKDYFYSPGANKKRMERRNDGGKFDADHQLKYRPAPVTWEQWCKQMAVVYPDHFMTGIGIVLMALLRDLVLKFSNNFPLGYCYGERQSGKSEFALSLQSVFLNDAKMFNLHSGTDAAFFTFVSRFRNCVVGLNEFDDKDVKPEWFQAIKGFYDVEGRKRNIDKHRMEEQPVNCMPVLCGQYLSTKDDNSITSRSLLCQFMSKPNRTKEEMQNFQKLVDWQKAGLNGMLTEILERRLSGLNDGQLKELYDDTLQELRAVVKERDLRWEDRVGRNYSLLITMLRWAAENWQMPYTLNQAKEYALARMMDVINIMTTTDVLMEFWRTIESLADSGVLMEGRHYRIEHVRDVELSRGEGKTVIIGRDGPRHVLYMWMEKCHAEYMKEQGKVSKTVMNKTSLVNYFKNREYWLGVKKQVYFTGEDPITKKARRHHTSAYAFDYAELLEMSINLQFMVDVPENYKGEPEPPKKAEKELPF